jgi:spore germination cell wall hydrolase CwlJ-like protein
VRFEHLKSLASRSSVGAILAAMAVAAVGAWIERADERRMAQRAEDLKCLAENVYHEARGEPLVGQYAVAEVTMNRVRSREFPDSVCAVVHQPGAFSWTGGNDRPAPSGYEWHRAQAIAEAVYDNSEAPLVAGALYYHATWVSPDWAPTRNQVTRIGRHLFYL